jgi:hypothetical protein
LNPVLIADDLTIERLAETGDRGITMNDQKFPLTHNAQCDDCAFRPGTEASSYSPTQLKAWLCLETGELFYCHKFESDEGAPVLCKGFAEAAAKRTQEGCQRPQSNEEMQVAKALIGILQGAREHQDSST